MRATWMQQTSSLGARRYVQMLQTLSEERIGCGSMCVDLVPCK